MGNLGHLQVGARAAITVLDPALKTTIAAGRRLGRVQNHPLLGKELPGGVRGVVAGDRWLAAETDA